MEQNLNTGYEKRDVNVSKIIAYTILVLIFIGGVIIGVTEYFNYYAHKLEYQVILSKPSDELKELRARENKILNNYELLDYSKGIYRIPIERAMKLMADEAYEKEQQKK